MAKSLSGSTEPSHVLRAMRLPAAALHGAIRLSFSRDSTDDDVDRVLEVLPEIIAKLRVLSPLSQERQTDAPVYV
jgi:cysteine desulfurase